MCICMIEEDTPNEEHFSSYITFESIQTCGLSASLHKNDQAYHCKADANKVVISGIAWEITYLTGFYGL